jgi:hypothetical protein
MGHGGKYSHILTSWYFYRPLLLLGCCSNLQRQPFQLRSKELMVLERQNSKGKPLKAYRLQSAKLPLRTVNCSHLLTMVPRSRIFLPWRCRRYVPPKRQFTQDLHGATSQKTAFFIVTAAKPSDLTQFPLLSEYQVWQLNQMLWSNHGDIARCLSAL